MIINTTPHDIVIRSESGVDTSIPKSGIDVRVTASTGGRNDIDGVPCPVFDADEAGHVQGLPDPTEGVIFLVSGLVGAALAGTRTDLLVPGTGPTDHPIRNEKGWIIAVTRLKRV